MNAPFGENYYFLPLGREHGGLFELLDLPPDTELAAVATRMNEKWAQLDQQFKDGRKAAREELKAGELSREEFDKRVGILKGKKTQGEQELNQAKMKFDAIRAELRKQGGKRATADGGAWMPMYFAANPAASDFWDLLDSPQALPQVELNLLAAINRRWVNGGELPAPNSPTRLPSDEYSHAGEVDAQLIRRLGLERELVLLLAADTLWGGLRFTNRTYWHTRLKEWISEIEGLGPFLRLGPLGERTPREYPVLCQPRDQTIDQLPAGEALVDDARPERSRREAEVLDQKQIRDLLAALLGVGASDLQPPASEAATESKPEPADRASEAPNMDELQALLEELAHRARNQAPSEGLSANAPERGKKKKRKKKR